TVQILSRSGHNHCVDWWALGVLLFYSVCGYLPFEGGDLMCNVYFTRIKWPQRWPASAQARSLVQALLQQDADRRLGAGGADEVKAHPFFAHNGVDFSRLPKCDGRQQLSSSDDRRDELRHHRLAALPVEAARVLQQWSSYRALQEERTRKEDANDGVEYPLSLPKFLEYVATTRVDEPTQMNTG
ncbi:MAG: hypothetical protein MHM6MM_009569, partial [Cercozoa sp. M6MM]